MTVLQFAAQGLFGEGVVLTAWLSLVHLRASYNSTSRARPAWRGWLLTAVTGALVLVYADAYHREPYTLQVRDYALDVSHGRADARTLRIVHLSDIQAHRIRPYEARVFRDVRALHPDLLVYTGDYVQNRVFNTRPRAFTDFNALLRRSDLHPPFGAYAVRGDADWDDWTRLFDGAGVRCLSNQAAQVRLTGGRSLVLVGLDLGTGRRKDPTELYRVLDSAPRRDLRLVIAHAPDFVEHLAGKGVDLALAGHTHGGQIVVPLFGPPVTSTRLPRRYAGGLHWYEGTPVEVSRGIGIERHTAPQVRFCCPPEIAVLEVRY